MFSKPLAVGALALSCVTAAVGGAYVAVRQAEVPQRPRVATEPAAAPTQPSPAVRETEAIVTPPTPLTSAPARPAAEAPTAPSQAVERTREGRESRVVNGPASPNQPAPAARAERARKPGAVQQPARIPERPSAPPVNASAAPSAAPAASTAATGSESPAARPELPTTDPVAVDPLKPEPAAPTLPAFEELLVPAAAVMGLRIETAVSTEQARIEDRVEARVTRDLTVDGRTAVPAGTRVLGAVTLVEKGGKVKERARLGVRFHTLVLPDGTELPLRTEAILREGESPAGDSSRKIGGAAVGGAILGAIMGGKKGAIVGGATGAAGGTAVVMAGDRNAATLPVGTVVTVRLSAPLTVAVEKQ